MSSFDNNLIVKDNGSYSCSAQSDSISSLQFDKRVKLRSYSSQFTLSDEVLIAVDRREEFRPIEDIITIEVDICNGICNDIRHGTNSKYSNIIRLDEMSSENQWVSKLTTYDTFVDKDILKSIREDAMEPNKLYLLKRQHQQQFTENMAGNYLAADPLSPRKPLRNTTAQFNPAQFDKIQKIDKLVYSSHVEEISNTYCKSKNILRNELIVSTGNFQYPINNNEQFSSSLSVDLATHELPKITNGKPLHYEEDEYIPKKREKVEVTIIKPKLPKRENSKIEILKPELVDNEENRVMVDDIPFAEETDASEDDHPDSRRKIISKSLQYYLPAFDTNQASPKSKEYVNSDEFDDNSRDIVSTDESQSSDNSTDKHGFSDNNDMDSMNADDFDESLDKYEDSLSTSFDQEGILMQPKSRSYDYNDYVNFDDIIFQENLVMHIHQTTEDIISTDQLEKYPKIENESNFSFSDFESLPSTKSFLIDPSQSSEDSRIEVDVVCPKNIEHTQPLFIEKEITPERDSLESQSSMIIKDLPNDDEQIFSKSKSFSLKRNSSKTDEDILNKLSNYSCNDNKPIIMQHPNYHDLQLFGADFSKISCSSIQPGRKFQKKSGNVLYSDRKEKLFNSGANTTIQFSKPVFEDSMIADQRRNSTSSSDGNTESVKNSSEHSMIIKEEINDDFYMVAKHHNYDINETLQEEEDETENMDNDVSNYENLTTASTEEIPIRDRDNSISEGSSLYSTSSTSTVNEIILRDLVKTPINSTPGHFENFLKEREERILSEKSEIDEKSLSTNEASINDAMLMDINNSCLSQIVNQDTITNDSSYTEDSSSSSSDNPQRVNTILRQGESIEDISKYLTLQDQNYPGLKRSSGFESQLNELYNQENNDKNLLYSDGNDDRCFSSSSDDNMSLSVTKDFQENFISKMTEEKIDKHTEKDSKGNIDSDDTLSASEDEHSQIQGCSKSLVDVDKENRISTPNDIIKPNDSYIKSPKHSSSDSSRSLSTSSDDQDSSNELLISKAKFVERSEINIPVPDVNRNKVLPKHHNDSDDNDSSRSLSFSTEEISAEKDKVLNKKNISNLPSNSKRNLGPISNKRIPKSLNSSDSSQSLSTSTEDAHNKKLKEYHPKSVDREEKTCNPRSKDKRKHLPISQNRYLNLSNESDGNESVSTSSEGISPEKLKIHQPKSIDREEKLTSSTPIDKRKSLPISKKITSHPPSDSESSSSLSSSTENLTNQIKLQECPSKSTGSDEKLTISPTINKQQWIPIPKKRTSISSKSFSTSTDEPTSKNELHEEDCQSNEKEDRRTPLNPDNHESSLQVSKNRISSESERSDSSLSLSTSTEDLEPKIESKGFQRKENSAKAPMKKGKPHSNSDSYSLKSVSTFVNENQPENEKQEISQPILSKPGGFHQTSENSSKTLISAPLTKEPSNKDMGRKPPPNYYADRREKFTKANKSQIDAQFRRSASVPNYLDDSSSGSVSSMSVDFNNNTIDKSRSKNCSQSSKTIHEAKVAKKIQKSQKCSSYELISVVLKDDPPKTPTLSIDRREKFSWGENINKIIPNNVKTGKKADSISDFSISTTSNSESDSEHLNNEEQNKLPRSILEPKLSNENGKGNKKPEETQKKPYSINCNADDKQKSTGDRPRVSIDKIESDQEFEENLPSENEMGDLQNTENEEDSLSISTSESISTSSDEGAPKMTNKDKSGDKENSPMKVDSRMEAIDPENNDHRIKKKLPADTNLDSITSESQATGNGSRKSKTKSIDRREKFAFKKQDNNLYQKPPKAEPPKQHPKRNSISNSVTLSDMGSKKKSLSKDREEKFTNQFVNQIKSEQTKTKSDSTDEDISFSLSSLPKEKIDLPGNPHKISNDRVREVFEPEFNRKENNEHSFSISSSTSTSKDQQCNKIKYDKSKQNASRSYQTLPFNKNVKEIPIREKSKSLEKPLTKIDLSPLNQSVSGSLGDIIETRYYEYTEKWSRQSPIDTGNSKKKEKKPHIDNNHISVIKNTDKFIKKRLHEPLTDRPRPVPSYLSPVYSFPNDQEFGSTDSLVNDYSSDNNAEEFRTKYKSLPDFITSLSTTSLKREPVINKTASIKKPPLKKNSSIEPINLNYGDIENEVKLPNKKIKREDSINSVTTDSSYLERPILREKMPQINRASPDCTSILTISSVQLPNKPIPKMKFQPPSTKSAIKINNEPVSSISSSSDTDTPKIESYSQSNPISYKSQTNNSHLFKESYIKKSNSMPQKRIPSSSESSELSSTSEEESIKIYQF